MTTSTLPTYSTISLHETQRLASVQASGCAVLTYQVLCGYSRVGKFFAFPSHATIREALGKAYSLRAIRAAILFLEKHRIIKRKNSGTSRRTKTIHLIARKARHLAENLFQASERNKSATMTTSQNNGSITSDRTKNATATNHHGGTNQPQKRTKKRTRFFNNKGNKSGVPEWRQRGNFGAFERSQPEEPSPSDVWFEEASAHLLRPDLWERPASPDNPNEVWEAIKTKSAISVLGTDLEAIKALVFS